LLLLAGSRRSAPAAGALSVPVRACGTALGPVPRPRRSRPCSHPLDSTPPTSPTQGRGELRDRPPPARSRPTTDIGIPLDARPPPPPPARRPMGWIG